MATTSSCGCRIPTPIAIRTLLNVFVVTVTDPTTNDNESVTVCETGSNTGLFTNRGGVCSESITFPSPSPSPPTAWLTAIGTGSQTVTEDWTLTYVAATTSWTVTGSVSGTQTATASHGGGYTSDGSELSFTLYEDAANLTDGTVLSLCTRGSDPLATSAVAGSADDGTLYVAGGDNIYVSYTNANAVTVTDIVPYVLMEVESSASGTKPVYHGPYTVTPEATGTIERVLGARARALVAVSRRESSVVCVRPRQRPRTVATGDVGAARSESRSR